MVLNFVTRLCYFLLLSFILTTSSTIANAATSDACSEVETNFFKGVYNSKTNQAILLSCIFQKIASISIQNSDGSVAIGDEDSPTDEELIMLKYVGALRSLLGDGSDFSVINALRKEAGLQTIGILAAGARSKSKTIRVDSALVLANIIDNPTYCVIAYNIVDARIMKTDYGRIGRSNLLGVTRVISRWAYVQNSETIKAIIQKIKPEMETAENEFENSLRLVANIEARLQPDAQLKGTNDIPYSNSRMTDSQVSECKKFADDNGFNKTLIVRY